ncbi:TPA: hypothetical protein N0F65_008771 [Lagenidium giganteum]|uniref:thioredoxin-dependent peroxiredoxin n=1 Tax=Lagenidium giganteum TaxID=4803 RepID=A0AAV2Z2W6_9STRA|nr:TPA: hypothetical protein N0F65_008771 [Lagenidium giganteum]
MQFCRLPLLVALVAALSVVRASTAEEKKSVEVQFPHVTDALLEQLGYQKKNRYSSSAAFKVTPRKPAPDFTDVNAVVDEKFKKISLKDYKGKWLVLFFYPFDFTFVCPTEIVSFSDQIDTFRSINTEVVAISTDSHHTHLAWIRTARDQGGLGKMNIPLIADVSKRISEDYGVLVTDEDDEMFGAALRGLFIIDPKGTIRSIQINDDAVGRSVDETLRLLKAFQYAAEHPHEVCPANWKPGGKTITTNHEDKINFFQSVYGKDGKKEKKAEL